MSIQADQLLGWVCWLDLSCLLQNGVESLQGGPTQEEGQQLSYSGSWSGLVTQVAHGYRGYGGDGGDSLRNYGGEQRGVGGRPMVLVTVSTFLVFLGALG